MNLNDTMQSIANARNVNPNARNWNRPEASVMIANCLNSIPFHPILFQSNTLHCIPFNSTLAQQMPPRVPPQSPDHCCLWHPLLPLIHALFLFLSNAFWWPRAISLLSSFFSSLSIIPTLLWSHFESWVQKTWFWIKLHFSIPSGLRDATWTVSHGALDGQWG